MDKNDVIFHPIISSIQKMALYETKSKYYLVGSNNTQTRFRVLKIDRMEARELEIYDDKVEYTAEEIHNLINMIDSGNRRAGGGGFSKVISAFGIIARQNVIACNIETEKVINQFDQDKFLKLIREARWDFVLLSNEPTEAWTAFNEIFILWLAPSAVFSAC
ncbi:hypothetical protein JTB14_035702 [Gonioctena quinquepunctata]|nr:hypothetical protein JTB14_035702 [Gonioctena quinquepunctata]